jgi:LuxR family maltose regulon positive regulatory protein
VARDFLWRAMETSRATGPAYHTRLQLGLAAVLFREGDLAGALVVASRLLELGKVSELPESMLFGRSFLGWAHYLRNELDEAEPYLETAAEDMGPGIKTWHAQSHFALALCRVARGRIDDARHLAQALTRAAVDRQQPVWIEEGRAFEAEVALRRGRIAEADAWAETFDPERPLQCNFLYIPQLTLAKLRIAHGTDASRREAAAILDGLRCCLEGTHDKLRVADTLVVEALVHRALGDEALAFEKLEAALALTEPGCAVRPYLDLGAPMASLLRELPAPACESEHVRRILDAFEHESIEQRRPAATPTRRSPTGPLIEPLTNREQDVLELLAERYRDKEIAGTLFISPGTVRSHLKALYQKLDVGDRRAAVSKARELGILPGS